VRPCHRIILVELACSTRTSSAIRSGAVGNVSREPVVAAPTDRFARPTVNLITVAARVGCRTSVRKAASSRANGRFGGRPRRMVAG